MGQLKEAPDEIRELVARQLAGVITEAFGTDGDVVAMQSGNVIHVEQATKPTEKSDGFYISFDVVINSVRMR